MADKVFLIHGWSVDATTTYQALHLKLAAHGFDLHEIFLGRYVSLDNEVEVKDIAQAMHRELVRHLGRPPWTQGFHFVTHSTGALVVKHWIAHHYVGKFVDRKPLKNVVFLAGPHFGSRLAHNGRSMLAHAAYFGPTGKQVLNSLELGSEYSWDVNELWLDPAAWRRKGIRPYGLIGDRVENDFFKSKIFPAGYEKGSDMVVRVPAGNLNFCRYELNGLTRRTRKVGEIKTVPFAALANYVHSGPKHGIMNSITADAKARHLSLKLILQCLRVKTRADYARARTSLDTVMRSTRRRRGAFAQLDFRFRDETGAPIDDYSFVLGVIVKGRRKPSKMIVHTHKNQITPSHFTAFLDLKAFEPRLTYFMDFNGDSGTEMFHYRPDPLPLKLAGRKLVDIICADRTTQIDVILGREPHQKLFVFHSVDDPDLHVEWDRQGEITRRALPVGNSGE